MDDLQIKEHLQNTHNAYQRYTDYKFDYMIRRSLRQTPEELNFDEEYNVFDPTQKILIACISNGDHESDVFDLRGDLKSLESETNSKRNEIKLINEYENGLKTNIKKLEAIISVKEHFSNENIKHEKIRCNAKEKVLREYNRVHTKYHKVLIQYKKSNKSSKNNSNETSKQIDLGNKITKYEAKLKIMNDVLQIANDNKNKLQQHEDALQVSRNRLKTFVDQLNEHIKNKEQLSTAIIIKEKQIKQLKITLSNLGVVSSIEKIRLLTSSNCMKEYNVKKEFSHLQNLRDDVLNSRPKGMFNPKYQKHNYFTKEEIRRYLENDETIDSIDYLIELKNNEKITKLNSFKYNQTSNSDETNIFVKCLSFLSAEDIKKLLIYYFMKNIDLRESERDNDNLIAELDETIYRHKRSIISINNDFQEFHLSIEKKFTLLKNNYQKKLNSLYTVLQEENNAITVYKMKQEISSLKKKIVELEKEKLQIAKSKEVPVKPRKSMDHLEASKSGSDVVSSARVTLHKNKLKIQKKLSKLTS